MILEFFRNYLSTIIAGAVVLAAVAAVAVKLYKDKKNHKSSCSCGCTGCPNSDACNRK